MEEIHERVEKARHANDAKLGFDMQDMKMLHDTQLRIMNKLDDLLQKTDHSMAGLASSSDQHKTGSHLGLLSEDVRSLQESVKQLTADIGRITGSYGITYKMEQLQNAISQLSNKLSQIDERSLQQHEETRSSIHYATSEKSSSMLRYLMFILGGQFVLYVAWNIYQQRAKNERRKYI
ncbi:hypothetical protein SYNPS1DRAFT_23210 [Syncephalis pseudoplumigaleata]|uniref:Uncharacterized protein n=1 Tax=Syncephalis pseudoplumigaleata TaxID=1712513 RepID=A0A4P9Z072_9FUNG|nr:hypothetical protein SYNPS1DRAFT_23210 [Syncephalis pseudoplumigaleata]|eukprot:RKP24730.1 hypothetical protein SYNPS1DRAFT_23210 [Syncephalis pseudoplumigaleata]